MMFSENKNQLFFTHIFFLKKTQQRIEHFFSSLLFHIVAMIAMKSRMSLKSMTEFCNKKLIKIKIMSSVRLILLWFNLFAAAEM
jgi:hypothetical protein